MRLLAVLVLAVSAYGQAVSGHARVRISLLNNHWSIPGYGLVAGWDLTGWAAGTQSVPSILPWTSSALYYGVSVPALQNGSTSGVDENDGAWSLAGWVGDGAATRCEIGIGFGTSPRTIITVAKARVEPPSELGMMLVFATSARYLAFSPGGGSVLAFSSNSWNLALNAVSNNTALALDTFAMVASVEGLGRHDVWLNTNVARYTPTGTPSGQAPYIVVGAYHAGYEYLYVLDGTISYILIYNRALSDAEILRVYRVLKRNLAVQGVALP